MGRSKNWFFIDIFDLQIANLTTHLKNVFKVVKNTKHNMSNILKNQEMTQSMKFMMKVENNDEQHTRNSNLIVVLHEHAICAVACGSTLVDCRVDVGRFVVAEGRAGWGQVKNDAMFTFSETKWRTQNKHDKK